MPEQIQIKMNGVIPSIPVTTLAGIASLSDLLTEMPLPAPLPQTLTNKSLLFHPRVADEAQILLSSSDENLVPQLIMSLSQTSSDHIELKDHYASFEQPLEEQQNPPELLQAILQTSPHVFQGPQYNSPRSWPQQSHQMASNYEGFSPSYSNSSSNSRLTPQDSPAHMGASSRSMLPGGIPHPQNPGMPVAPQNHTNVTQSSPFTVPSPSPRATVITEQTRTSTTPQHMMEDTHCLNNIASPFEMHSPAHMSTPSPLVSTLGNVTPQHHAMASGMTPQHNIQMTPPSDSGIPSSQHQPQQQQQQQHHHHSLHQPHQMHHQQQLNVHQQMFDPMINRPLHQPHLPQGLDIDHTIHDNQQFVLDQVAGLPDIDIPIGSLDASHSRDLMSAQLPVTQVNVFDNVSASVNLNNAMMPLPDPVPVNIQQQPHMLFNQQHPMQPTLAQHHLAEQQQFSNEQLNLHQQQHEIQQMQQLQYQQPDQQQQLLQEQPMVQQQNNAQEKDVKIPLKEPVIMLNRLLADQALLKQKLNSSAEKSVVRSTRTSISSRDDKSIKSESDSEEEIGKNNKYFKAKAKERQAKKEREKAEKKGSVDDKRVLSSGRRKRLFEEDEDDKKDEIFASVKPKIRKFEKKLVPVLPKLSVEELMETNTYQRFNMLIETIFENTEEAALDEIDEDGDVPAELLISDHQLQALCSEAAKLKSLGAMESVPAEKLVRLLNILEKNIRDGAKVSPLADPDDDAEQSKMWMQIAMSRVQQAVDASLVCLHIMTSSNMPKTIFLEDVIDRIIQFIKFQLQNTIFPSYDPVYRIDSRNKTDNFNASGRKKRSHAKEVREKNLLMVYSKLNELVGLLAELLGIQILTDTSVLHASTLGVAPFFVENVSDLQLSSLKLVTVIFTKYEKHRRILLEDIIASIARLPSSKRSLRTYRLSTDEYIQMLTALVLQLIQCVVVLSDFTVIPTRDNKKLLGVKEPEDKKDGQMSQLQPTDVDVLVLGKYDAAQRLAGNFLTAFLNKCGSKGEEIDYRPLFENFVQDLLATVNKPEWPAAELMLSLLGKLLVQHFTTKNSDMSLRVASIEYLGVVAARLRKDAVSSQCKLDTIDQIIRDIKLEQSRDIEYDQVKDKDISGLSESEERVVFLQKVMLDYLAVNGTKDSALGYARHFYLAQWYKDCAMEKQKVGQPKNVLTPSKKLSRKMKAKKKGGRNRMVSDDESEPEITEDLQPDENDNDSEQKYSETYRIIDERKKLIISKIRPYSSGTKPDILQTYIDYNTAELITQYLASTRPFSQSFDRYLRDILCVLTENSIAIRTKAMKCLTMIVEADPNVLARSDMQLGVKHSFLDHSTSVREAAVDLVGKFVLSRPVLIDKYYDILLARILDTGVSVRKRVIKILKDICMEFPEYEKIPEICVKMIRRVNDEEGIRKLVMEVFQNMWFTPVKEKPILDHKALLRKVMNITDVVAACKDIGLEWFEQLLVSLFKPKEDKEDSTKMVVEPPKALVTACTQIVDCLIENVLRLEETNLPSPSSHTDEGGDQKRGSSQRLVACLTTLHLFAKIRPQLLVNHAITLQPYLSLKCQTQGDYQIISSVAHTLELVVPLIEHPSETFLAQLEEDSVKLILQHDRTVVSSCLSCLGSIVNNVTRNFKLIRDCFNKYYGSLTTYKSYYEQNPDNPLLQKFKPFFRRALFTVGLLLRHFDFTDLQVIDGLPENIKDQVFETLSYFVNQENDDARHFTLSAIGSLCIRHYDFMMLPQLEELYHYFLTSDCASVQMRIQVLKNIELYLAEEEKRMIKQDLEWAKMSKKENLKEMGDISSGMASAVIQRYLKQILESFLHANLSVRHAALKVIQLILAQGLVHPVTIVPYLICMSTDFETSVSHSADKQLQEIEKKYPGFVHTKASVGIKLSYRLQQILQKDAAVVRGMRVKENEYPSALNGFLYTILRSTKQQRRAIVQSFLKQFDESVKTSLSQMLYLADNLAYFSYQVQDEPLFIIHHIDIVISMAGTNLLQLFKEALLPKIGAHPKPQEQLQQPQPIPQPMEMEQQQLPQEQVQQQQQQHEAHLPLLPQQYPYPQLSMYYPQAGEMRIANELAVGLMPMTGLNYPSAPTVPQQVPLVPQPTVEQQHHSVQPQGRTKQDPVLAALAEDEEDDEEDEESVLQRLPQDTKLLRQYINASQGFLLLLTLRQHLKDLYGFSDAKISQYSPSEAAKVYEKAVNRKNNLHFKPKNTLQRLKNDKKDEDELDEQGRQQLVKEYLDFKQLIMKFDPDDPEEDDDDAGGSAPRSKRVLDKVANSSEPDRPTDAAGVVQYQVHQVQEHPNNSMNPVPGPPRVPKLTIHASHHPTSAEKDHHRKHRTHKPEKPKKHKKKKRRRLSDSSDSAEDFSDPDYQA
ncbi:nipped-B-like protein [Copidosoma floridanum]|uniref:nipped-B-like protein n=1 Tax=Copidosoma floridanum TaxID=29053 RepID=UPI0006C9D3B4|nr:nipped-B-like protein [Copidosoma floridanum]